MKAKILSEEIKEEISDNKIKAIIYFLLRTLIIACGILQFFNGNYENVFLCLLSLLLLLLPSIAQIKFNVEFPSTLEIVIFIFIFSAEILGEIESYYITYPYWDMLLHTINGFLCAALGFSLVDTLNRQKRYSFELSPFFLVLVAFCFSMTIGVLWEFIEFFMDKFFLLDMQKDTIINTISTVTLDPSHQNNVVVLENIFDVSINGNSLGLGGYLDIGLIDTMEDLFVNLIGALTFSIWEYIYFKKEKKYLFKDFIPTPRVEKHEK